MDLNSRYRAPSPRPSTCVGTPRSIARGLLVIVVGAGIPCADVQAGWVEDVTDNPAIDVRWKHLPGTRLSEEKARDLMDEALSEALLRDGWLGEAPGRAVFAAHHLDSRYEPSVDGLAVDVLSRAEIDELRERVGQVTVFSTRIRKPWSLQAMNVAVSRSVWLSDARYEAREYGCGRATSMACRTRHVGWDCEIVERSGARCLLTAFDDDNWRNVPGLDMTPAKQRRLWNRILTELPEERMVAATSGGKTALAQEGLEPGWSPDVPGRDFEMLSAHEMRRRAERDGRFTYLRLEGYRWWRGPIRVRSEVTIVTEISESIRLAGEVRHEEAVRFDCEPNGERWSCEVRGP